MYVSNFQQLLVKKTGKSITLQGQKVDTLPVRVRDYVLVIEAEGY